MYSQGILVDTSVWVKFFRFSDSRESAHLDSLLQSRGVRICAPIHAEILSGAKNEHERARLQTLFSAGELLPLPENIWDEVSELRFKLARKGHQTSLIDLIIACTSAHHAAPLWSLDKDFELIGEELRFPRYLPA